MTTTDDAEPLAPPDTYDPSFGTVAEYVAATMAHARYWQGHPHRFQPCPQCVGCGRCFRCGLRKARVVHVRAA